MLILPSIEGLGCAFIKVPVDDEIGLMARMPRAARTVYEYLHLRARFFPGSQIRVKDREAAAKCQIQRRTWQKGLFQLQAMNLIQRIGRGINRVIHFFDRFAKPRKPAKKHAGRKATGTASPIGPATAHVAAPPAASVRAGDPPEVQSPEERAEVMAGLKRIVSGTTRAPEVITDEERDRRARERQKILLDQIAARKGPKRDPAPAASDRVEAPAVNPPALE